MRVKISIALIIIILLSACSSHRSTRKCNGKKGIRTSMGLM